MSEHGGIFSKIARSCEPGPTVNGPFSAEKTSQSRRCRQKSEFDPLEAVSKIIVRISVKSRPGCYGEKNKRKETQVKNKLASARCNALIILPVGIFQSSRTESTHPQPSTITTQDSDNVQEIYKKRDPLADKHKELCGAVAAVQAHHAIP